jgi:hypothetical protein
VFGFTVFVAVWLTYLSALPRSLPLDQHWLLSTS